MPAWQWSFQLARKLKALVPARTEAVLLRTAVIAFAEVPLIAGNLDGLGLKDPLDFFDDFRAKWDEVRFAEGAGPLEVAYERARIEPLSLGAQGGPTYGVLISVAYHLQVAAGSKPVLLPLPRLSGLLGKSAPLLSSLIKLGIKDGYLVVEDPNYSYSEHKARTFRVDIDKLAKFCRARSPLH